MRKRNTMTAILLLSFGTLFAGCGGGSGGSDVIPGGGGGSTTYAPSFTPQVSTPQPDMVTMASVVVVEDELTVGVNVTETDGIASASLEITYNPAYLEFVDWSCGSLLPPCGSATLALSDNSTPGRLILGLARTNAGEGSDAFGTEVLLRMTFRALRGGASPLGFDNSRSALGDPDLNDIPGITWHGGTVITN